MKCGSEWCKCVGVNGVRVWEFELHCYVTDGSPIAELKL